MQDINGPQILLRLATNQCYKQIVKVMWSTSSRTHDIEDCKRLGAKHYFIKPGTIDELTKTIREITTIFEMALRPAH